MNIEISSILNPVNWLKAYKFNKKTAKYDKLIMI